MFAYSRARHCRPGRRRAPIALSFDPYPYLLPLSDHFTRALSIAENVIWSIGPAAEGWLCAEHEPCERAPVRYQLVAGAAQQRLAGGAQTAERLPTGDDCVAQLPVARAKQPGRDYKERQARDDRQNAAGQADQHTQQRKRTAGRVRWVVFLSNIHSGSTHAYKLAISCVYGTRLSGEREGWEDERYLMDA
jgi:hypothetical protein